MADYVEAIRVACPRCGQDEGYYFGYGDERVWPHCDESKRTKAENYGIIMPMAIIRPMNQPNRIGSGQQC